MVIVNTYYIVLNMFLIVYLPTLWHIFLQIFLHYPKITIIVFTNLLCYLTELPTAKTSHGPPFYFSSGFPPFFSVFCWHAHQYRAQVMKVERFVSVCAMLQLEEEDKQHALIWSAFLFIALMKRNIFLFLLVLC